MVTKHDEKRRNRATNAGGVPVDAYLADLTLATAMNELRPKFSGNTPQASTEFNLFHFYFLYLWLTGKIYHLTQPSDIPNLQLIPATQACCENGLRRIRENAISWVEYAIVYPSSCGHQYLWQPVPSALNPLLSDYLTNHPQSLQLSDEEKDQLYWQLKTRKWRAPEALRHQHMLRKDVLFDVILHQASIDPFLSTPAKHILVGRTHHRSALSYQKLSSDQIRYEIFSAHNRYFSQLATTINSNGLRHYCELTTAKGRTLPVLSQAIGLPQYLQSEGEICAYTMVITDGTKTYIPIAATYFGSHRALNISDLRVFFRYLRQHVTTLESLDSQHSIKALRQYHNAQALELSLLLVLLAGVRPTHHITLESHSCFDLRFALVRDKGRYRSVELCPYLKTRIEDYLRTKQQLTDTLALPQSTASDLMWYHMDDKHVAQPHTPKQLRMLMNQHWQVCFEQYASSTAPSQVVPYQLRHSFAQHALLATNPRLTSGQIDLLMGHSNLGEHLGDHYGFSSSNHILTEHLHQWSQLLHLDAYL